MVKRAKGRPSKPIHQPGQLVLFEPEYSWEPIHPDNWPDFRKHARIIGFDTETSDPNLTTKGPGFLRGDAEVCGVSLAAEDGERIYLPFNHTKDNYDRDTVINYVKHQLGGDQRKCGANILYDVEALDSLGITKINGDWCDIQVAGPLLDEERKGGYSLEALALHYLGEGKTEEGLKEAAAIYGVEPKKGMKFLPGGAVAEYAEDDAYFPIEIFLQQENEIYEEDLERVFKLEQRLQPVLWAMRKQGTPVDLEYFEKLSNTYKARIDESKYKLLELLPYEPNYNSSADIGRCLIRYGYEAGEIRQVRGEPSPDNDWLAQNSHDPVCKMIRDVRVAEKMKKDFVDSILANHINGRVHCNWHQLRSDSDEDEKGQGTRSGRMSATRINLQQIPARDPVYGPEIRRGFVAFPCQKFCSNDFSAQEPRWVIEFANKVKFKNPAANDAAAEFMRRYKENPFTDYHNTTIELIKEKAGMELTRSPAKDISLGSLYGMQKRRLSEKLGLSVNDAEPILKAYHEGVPFVQALIDMVIEYADKRGYVKTILGRKRRFTKFEPTDWDMKKRYGFGFTVDTEQEARQLFGDKYKRAFMHKVLNGIIQGSSGDQTKTAVCNLYYDHGITPLMQVHDEINNSIDPDDDGSVIRHVMENAIETQIPFVAKAAIGNNWAECK
jgi:DNA polymerase-1